MIQKKNWLIIIAGVALLVAVLACNFIVPQSEPNVPAFATEDPYLEVPRVKLDEAKTAFDNHTAIFLDARSQPAYAESHIPGALSIPADELVNHLDELDKNQWIITYCT